MEESSNCSCHDVSYTTIRGKRRCVVSGHRIAVRGIPPRQTREQPIWTWHREILDRRLARSR